MTRNGAASPGAFTADKQREGYCDSRLPMWKLVQWHEYMTQEGINSQLRTHSILSPFVTCTFYKKFPAESYAAVYLNILSMQLLSHRGTDWLHPLNPKKHQCFFPPEKIYSVTPVSRRHFLPIKDMALFYIFLHKYPHLPSPYWGLFNEKKKPSLTELHLLLFCTKTVLKINHLWWFSASPLCILWTAHGLYTFLGRQKYRVCKII